MVKIYAEAETINYCINNTILSYSIFSQAGKVIFQFW